MRFCLSENYNACGVLNQIFSHRTLLLSGGLQFTAQKHREGSKFKYNSGFFITTNVYPDFGPGPDSDAIRRRLSVFETKPLPRKDNNATGKHFSCNFSCMSPIAE